MEEQVREQNKNPLWESVFQFALARFERKKSEKLPIVVKFLLRFGNPFLVGDAIRYSNIALERELNSFCLWLAADYCNWLGLHPPDLNMELAPLLAAMFHFKHHDSRYLFQAQGLLDYWEDEPKYRSLLMPIKQAFLGEFQQLLSDQNPIAVELKESFVRCPKDPEDDTKSFKMGSGQTGEGDENRHDVKVKPFQLAKNPITNAMYELFNPSHKQFRNKYSRNDQQPVVNVDWYEAEMFCVWLGAEFRLPTEAEWEFACRAETTTEYHCGDELTHRNANFGGHLGCITAVGSYTPNRWGLYDMHGNVWEWCSDRYGKLLEEGRTPRGTSQGWRRVIRGGSWLNDAADCRSASRNSIAPYNRYHSLGFRVAQSSNV